TVGGTTSGYSVIGNCQTAIAPVIKNSSEITAAKIGRRIKNCDNISVSLTAVFRAVCLCSQCIAGLIQLLLLTAQLYQLLAVGHFNQFGLDLHIGPHTLSAVNN